ncbi:MAG TPA: hypothetical protein VJX67_05795 [Blastocatellia bacterium]|nr:hypothetical protein [Blastocatellia bacterium]
MDQRWRKTGTVAVRQATKHMASGIGMEIEVKDEARTNTNAAGMIGGREHSVTVTTGKEAAFIGTHGTGV